MNRFIVMNIATRETYTIDSVYEYRAGEIINPLQLPAGRYKVIKAI